MTPFLGPYAERVDKNKTLISCTILQIVSFFLKKKIRSISGDEIERGTTEDAIDERSLIFCFVAARRLLSGNPRLKSA